MTVRICFIPPVVRFDICGRVGPRSRVFAWEDIEDGLWRDPEFIRRNEGAGKSVQIDERTRATVELTAVPFSF